MEQEKKNKKKYSVLEIISGIIIPLLAVYFAYYLSKKDNQKEKNIDFIKPPTVQSPDTVVKKSKIFPDTIKNGIKHNNNTESQLPSKTEAPRLPKTELISPPKKATKILLEFECSQNNGLVFSANGELTISEENTISGMLNYTLTKVPNAYKNNPMFKGYPTATELIRGSIIGNTYLFKGEKILYDANGLYVIGTYKIFLNNDGTLTGTCKDINLESSFCDLVGTYKTVELKSEIIK